MCVILLCHNHDSSCLVRRQPIDANVRYQEDIHCWSFYQSTKLLVIWAVVSHMYWVWRLFDNLCQSTGLCWGDKAWVLPQIAHHGSRRYSCLQWFLFQEFFLCYCLHMSHDLLVWGLDWRTWFYPLSCTTCHCPSTICANFPSKNPARNKIKEQDLVPFKFGSLSIN